jgi:hypothetical protein
MPNLEKFHSKTNGFLIYPVFGLKIEGCFIAKTSVRKETHDFSS